LMNVTDVGHLQSDADEGEDKLEVKARQEKTSPSTGGREDLSRDPAHCTVRVPHDFAGGFAFELSSIP